MTAATGCPTQSAIGLEESLATSHCCSCETTESAGLAGGVSKTTSKISFIRQP